MTKPGIIPIGDARRIARDRNVPIIVIFAIHANREEFTVTSYGQTKALCRVGGDYAQQFAQAIMESKVIAQSKEPLDIHDGPAIYAPIASTEPA